MKKLILAGAIASLLAFSARANFIVDDNPSNKPALNLDELKNSSIDTGNVNGDLINIETIGNADFSSGVATITPVSGGTLTSVTFTPADNTLFSDFSTRGQLNVAGDVTITVMDDNQQTFTFTIKHANQDFGRIGIVAEEGSGETISWVRVEGDFKEVKQMAFSYAPGVPDGGATLLLLGSALVGLGALRRRIKG